MDLSSPSQINLQDQRITILGLGASGLAAIKLARHLGGQVFASDSHTNSAIKSVAEDLKTLDIAVEIGGHSDAVFNADLWIASPGIPQNAPLILKAKEQNIPVVSEIEFASWFTKAPLVAVTGSNGKTTTVHLLAEMCQTNQLHGCLCGNVGIPFSAVVQQDLVHPDPKRVFILEISSFQMEHIIHFKPYISVFLNLTPDHLDRYKNMDEYVSAKLALARNQDNHDFIVYNLDDSLLTNHFQGHPSKKRPFSLTVKSGSTYFLNNTKILDEEHATLIHLEKLALPGRHNLANALAAATAAHILGIPDSQIQKTMSSFGGVEHRLEKVSRINGVTYYNDSKATNVEAVKVALDSFTAPILLILGGKDKGAEFSQLLPHTHNKVKEIVAYGQAREKISAALRDAVRLEQATSLKEAVEICHRCAEPGDIVLLSPGCASFDQFKNFEERGRSFKSIVQNLKGLS
ncbi:MAG: UDP-N-acetylmuramoyl-L-alanine--D-glutamate ligase [Fidelibacterota bacterium]